MKKLIEKIKAQPFTALWFVGILAAWGFMQLSAWQVFHNMYQCSCSVAGGGWRFLGLVLTAGSVAWVYGLVKDKNYVTKGDTMNVVILFALVLLSFLAYMGFTTGYGCV
jgi:hypothetical protein